MQNLKVEDFMTKSYNAKLSPSFHCFYNAETFESAWNKQKNSNLKEESNWNKAKNRAISYLFYQKDAWTLYAG